MRHQLDEAAAYEQMTFKEYMDPFTGNKNNIAIRRDNRQGREK